MIGPLSAVRLFVHDLDAARAFYEGLGLPLEDVGGALVGRSGTVDVVIESDDGEHDGLSGRFAGLSFAVEDAARVHADLMAQGVDLLGPPERQPWGAVLLHLRDPSGNVLTLVQAP